MPECPRCHQSVEAKAIVCPHCRMELKAYGHPGIPLYRASGGEPLCLTCVYDADDSCTFPKRPNAMDCTLYRDMRQSNAPAPAKYTQGFLVKTWLKRHQVWLLLAGLLLISLIVTLLR